MIGTDFQKHTLAIRRDHRDMTKAGWEFVGEDGGRLWELHRGPRIGHVIFDVRIAKDGRSLWVKTEDRVARILGREVPKMGATAQPTRTTTTNIEPSATSAKPSESG